MNKLLEERQACLARAEALLKTIEAEARAMTAEEQSANDADMKRVEEIDAAINDINARAEALKKASEIRAKVVNPLTSRGTFDGKQEMKDLSNFSLGKALRSVIQRGTVDGVEKEVFDEGREEARSSGIAYDSRAMIIPASAIRAMHTRATTVGGTSGATVPVDVYPTIFEMFRNRQVLTRLGATVLDNLVGNVKINTQTAPGSNSVGVLAETATATALDPTLNSITLSPHRIAAYTQLSNQLIMQSTPNVEAFAMNNLMKSIMTAFQGLVFQGAAAGAIVGIPNITGVNLENVATADKPTWAEILKLVEGLAGVDFQIETSGFALNATTMATLMSTLKSANNFEFIMSEFLNNDGLKSLCGLKAAVSNSVGDEIIFGDWSNLFVGMWGGIGLIYDPYTQAKAGSVEVIAEVFADAQVGNPALFSVLSMDVASGSGSGSGAA